MLDCGEIIWQKSFLVHTTCEPIPNFLHFLASPSDVYLKNDNNGIKKLQTAKI